MPPYCERDGALVRSTQRSIPHLLRRSRMTDFDLAISFPSQGVIRLRSRSLFGDAENPHYRRFLEGVFQVDEISNITITGGTTPQADLQFCPETWKLQDVAKRVTAVL